MISKFTMIFYLYNIINIIRIIIPQMQQYIQFNLCLMFKFLFISNNFNSYYLPCFMIIAS